MDDSTQSLRRILVVAVQTRVCALPLVQVMETMRPLPVEPIAGLPSFVPGVSIVRGVPIPVVDLALLLGISSGVAGRFVTLRLGERQVALSVDAVLGIQDLDGCTIQKLPPLLRESSKDVIEAIGTLDAQLLFVLRAAWELPEEVWQALVVQEVSR